MKHNPTGTKPIKQKTRYSKSAASHQAGKATEPGDTFQENSDVLSDHAAAEPLFIEKHIIKLFRLQMYINQLFKPILKKAFLIFSL